MKVFSKIDQTNLNETTGENQSSITKPNFNKAQTEAVKYIYTAYTLFVIGFYWAIDSVNTQLQYFELALLVIITIFSSYCLIVSVNKDRIQESLKILFAFINMIFISLLITSHYPQHKQKLTGSLNFSRISLQILLVRKTFPCSPLELINSFKNSPELKKNKDLREDLSNLLCQLSKSNEELLSDQLETPETISNLSAVKELSQIDSIDFNVFLLKEQTCSNELITLNKYFYDIYDFGCLNFGLNEFLNFSNRVQAGYLKNPYHCATHAADVVQSVHLMLTSYALSSKLDAVLNAMLLISAGVHDLQHPGLTNSYLINSKDKLARLYNDTSVLENHHVSSAFEIIHSFKDCNFFSKVDTKDYSMFRKIMIELVISTDFLYHNHHLSQSKALKPDNLGQNDKIILAKLIFHSCDVLNPARPWEICQAWTSLIFEEYFNQGDLERSSGYPISALCDRFTVSVPNTQLYFIPNVIAPCIDILIVFSGEIQVLKKNLIENLENWKVFPINNK